MSTFIPGLELVEAFFHEGVEPVMADRFPHLSYSAARIDSGSEVLGFDTPRSMDHDWGPRLTVFLDESDVPKMRESITVALSQNLPREIRGIPTNYDTPEDDGGRVRLKREGPIAHRVAVDTVPAFFAGYLGLNPEEEISERDWLVMPQQRLCTILRGRVFHDGLQRLAPARKRLEWYPHDIWLYLLMCQWRRIDQEEPFMARCGDVGDELGSRIVASRQVREIMKICFLMEKQYSPYNKWFGSAFAQLRCSKEMTPILFDVLSAGDWKDRERHLSRAYIHLAGMHNDLGLTDRIEPGVSDFHGRPYQVPHSGRFVDALFEVIESNFLKSIPLKIGSIDQFVDSTDMLCWIDRCKELGRVYA